MKKLIIMSKQVNIPVQEFTPDKESDYLQLVAYEASNRLKRIKERANKFREAEYEKLVAL